MNVVEYKTGSPSALSVVYAANDQYARHLGVSMYSLFYFNRDLADIRIYVFSIGITGASKARLSQIAARFSRQLEFIPMEDIKERFSYEIDTGSFDISAMGRLFVGTALPKAVERVLYLDCDTMVLDTLGPLWRADLKGNPVGAVMEPTIYRQVKESIGLGEADPYFNSGVLLIDVKRWRQENVETRLLSFYAAMGGTSFACDQDTLNGALKGQISALPPRYNFFTNYFYFSYEALAALSPPYRAVPKKSFLKARKKPAVIHFAGDERPWRAGNFNPYRKVYEACLNRTPWRGTPKEAGYGTWLLAYHMMNVLTRVCPGLRRLISEHFGMKAVNARKANREKDEKRKLCNFKL